MDLIELRILIWWFSVCNLADLTLLCLVDFMIDFFFVESI